ncbi:MAG TPA: hypothetical protein VII57_10220 [Dehalococcoidia bacterium]
MPKAFSLTYGLDLETEMASFWAWLHDARDILRGEAAGSREMREVIEGQREEIERIAAAAADPDAARFEMGLAIALVGFHHASIQKLLNGLQDYGLLEPPGRPAIFDTIVEPPLEDTGPPR